MRLNSAQADLRARTKRTRRPPTESVRRPAAVEDEEAAAPVGTTTRNAPGESEYAAERCEPRGREKRADERAEGGGKPRRRRARTGRAECGDMTAGSDGQRTKATMTAEPWALTSSLRGRRSAKRGGNLPAAPAGGPADRWVGPRGGRGGHGSSRAESAKRRKRRKPASGGVSESGKARTAQSSGAAG